MGFDISSHPVDVALIQSRLLPYLQGQGAIDDLVAEAARLTRTRFRANAWGLGLVALEGGDEVPVRKPLFSLSPPAPPPPKVAVPKAFEPDLHLWGRPYFITAPAAEVSAMIDRYAAATPEQVDAIAMQELARLEPTLPNAVVPDAEGSLPPDAQLAAGLRADLDLFREAYPNIANGRPVRTPDGERIDPEDLFLFTMPLAVVTFAAHLTPGWMARGYVHPTAFLEESKLDADGLFETPASLFEPLLQSIGGWEEAFHATITQNYSLGGYVRPANVPHLCDWWEAHRGPLLAPYGEGKKGEPARLAYAKILEAMHDARRRKFAFLEATEVYSGFQGIMN